MKKIISALTVFAMLLSFAAFPAFAETVDFTSAENIAYGKKVTHIKGTNYTGLAPSETNQKATDGDITTAHGGTGNNSASGSPNGFVFSLDLENEYVLKEITLYVQTGRTVNMYAGSEVDANKLLGTVTAQAVTVNGSNTFAATLSDITGEAAKTRYITFEYNSKYEYKYFEIYVKGEASQSGGNASGGGNVSGGGSDSSDEEEEIQEKVDFKSAENIAYGKAVTVVSGTASKPARYTDGDITTSSDMGGGSSYATKSFRIDLAQTYGVSEVVVYCHGSTELPRELNIYIGTETDNGVLAGALGAEEYDIYTEEGKDYLRYTFTFSDEIVGKYITVEHPSTRNFYPYEVYAKGTATEEPELKEEVSVDFTAAENIAFGKAVTHIKGSYYSSGPAPSATNQKATDGDVTTFHNGYGKEGSAITGFAFSLDFGEEYELSEIDIYLASTQSERGYEIYSGTEINESNLIATVEPAGKTVIVNGEELSPTHASFTVPVKTRYITVSYNKSSGFAYYEIYAKGTKATPDVPEPEEPEEPAETVDFASGRNIAYNKPVTPVCAGIWYSNGAPSATNRIVTDGNFTTGISADGDGEVAPTEGVKFTIDLGEEYELENIKFYDTNRGFTIYNGALTADENDGFKLKNADGSVAEPIATATLSAEKISVNGTEVAVAEADLSGVTARYLTFEYASKYSVTLKEIYISKVYSPTDEISIGDITSELPDEISKDVTLPTELDNGAQIEWRSTSPHVIAPDGTVTPQEEDMRVGLTAVMTYNGKTYTKLFVLTVPAKKTEYIAWTDAYNIDFVESERSNYKIVAKDTDGNIIENYTADSSKWEEEFLTGGGWKYTSKGGANLEVTYFEPLESETSVGKYKVGFTFKLSELPGDLRWYVKDPADKYITGIYISTSGGKPRIGFGPTSSYKDRHWYSYVDYTADKTTIELIYDPAAKTVYPYVNGESAVRADDNTKFFSYTGAIPSKFITAGLTTPIEMYDLYLSRGSDPTKSCDYASITNEDYDKITKNLSLADSLSNGSDVTWESSNPDVITNEGIVIPALYDERVTMTACITFNGQPLYKSFDFIVPAANKAKNNFILSQNDFASTAPYYVMKVPADSSGAVKNGKLLLSRKSEGELSAQKFFVSDMKENPYIIKGAKIIIEQYMKLAGDLDFGSATLADENGETVAVYGFEEAEGEYVFFVRTSEDEITVPYSVGQEAFIRIEYDSVNSTVNALVNNRVITAEPLRVEGNKGVSSVKYEAGDGEEGALSIDGVTFMLEGADHDKFKVTLDGENLTITDLTAQDPENIVSDLAFSALSRFGCGITYESSNPEVISNYGFVKRGIEDTRVNIKVTVKKGNYSTEKSFEFNVRGQNPDNLSGSGSTLSSGAVSGSSEKNAVDGLTETAFITSAPEKYFTIVFDSLKKVNKVLLMEAKNENEEYGVKNYTIDVSEDGYNWKTVYNGNEIGAEKKIEFDEVSTKYVRYSVVELEGNTTGLYELGVFYEPVASVAAQLDLDSVSVTPSDYVIKDNVTLSKDAKYGSSIKWESSHPDILSNEGKLLKKPSKDTVITLTVTVTNNGVTLVKKFKHAVKAEAISGSPGGGGGGGGGGSSSNKEVGSIKNPGLTNTETTKPVESEVTEKGEDSPVPSKKIFADVENDRWSYNYIKELKDAGIVSGDGTNFNPTANVTREEFVKMLILSLGLTPGGTASFADVKDGAWYEEYVAAAVSYGIVQGVSEAEFGIGMSITRQDMAVMTLRALTKLEIEVESGASHLFADSDEISEYALEAVNVLSGAGILSGDGEKFAPLDNLTREQAAKVLCMIRKEITE